MQNYAMSLTDGTTITFCATDDNDALVIADFIAATNNQDISSIFNTDTKHLL